jgi:uncharacterized protein VirK/YbjX
MISWRHRRPSDGLAEIEPLNWFNAARELLPQSLKSPGQDALSMRLAQPGDSELGELVAGRTGEQVASRAFESPSALRWPEIDTMLQGDFVLTWSRRVKYQIRLGWTLNVRQQLLDECTQVPFAAALLSQRPRAFHPLMNHLLDRRLGAQGRLTATLASIRRVCDSLPGPTLDHLLTDDMTLMSLVDGTRITFSLSGVSFHEGLWQVGLITASGMRLYSLGFGFTDVDTILIGNVQGPSLGQDGLALIRAATHAAHGMRPAHLLLHTLRLLAAAWRVKVLLGIDPEHHVKGRWNLRRSRLRFDYRAFWAECGAVPHPSGNWSMPVIGESRPLTEVPAKRRAMYRRRYQMLDQLECAIASLPNASPPVARADTPAGNNHAPALTRELEVKSW